ncbi:MAG: autotransporter domain-containing protein, partial [Ruegeria sp.]
ANAGSGTATAVGLNLGDGFIGDVTNSGTLNVQASAASTAAVAYGLRTFVDVTGNISNSGSLSVSARGADTATAAGFRINGNLTGAFSNTGNISVAASASDLNHEDVIAVGVEVSGHILGGFANSGSLSVMGTGEDQQAYVYGLLAQDGVTGDVLNSGLINSQVASATSADVYGIRIDNGLDGAFSNTGTIRIVGRTDDDDLDAYGAYIRDGVSQDVTNSGVIILQATAGDSAEAVGLAVSGEVDASIVNSGTISTVAESGGGQALTYGIRAVSGLDGSVINSGAISVLGNGATEATAAGVYINREWTGALDNSGTISVVADAQDEEARAYGLLTRNGELEVDINNSGSMMARASSDKEYANAYALYFEGEQLKGSVSNSGSLVAQAQSQDTDAEAYGIYADKGVLGSIDNSGTISAVAEGAASAKAQAVLLRNTMSADVTNSGTVTATATLTNVTDGSDGIAAGFYIEDMQGNFANSGTIQASASGGEMINAYGLYFENFDGEITAVGEISAASDAGDAYAIYLGNGTGTLNVVSTDKVGGLIRVQDHNVNLDANGGSAIFEFEDAAVGSGAFTTTVSDGRSAWFVQDEGGAAPVYASVDSSDLLPSGDVTAFYGSAINGSANALSYGAQAQVTRNSTTGRVSGVTFGTFRPYVMVDAAARQFENVPGVDTDVTVFNGSVGYSGQLDNGLALALGLGVFRSNGDTDTIDFDTDGVYLDASVGRQVGAYTIEAGLGFGWLSTDRSREITGSADADADYDSTLLTAYLGLERSFDVSDAFGLVGFGDVRYTRQEDDGYTESGSSANATVGDVTTEVIEARLGVEAEKALNNGGALVGQLSGVLRRDLGDNNATVTVFSSTQSLSFASTDFTGASVLIGYEHEFAPNMQFEANAEHEIGDDAQGPNFQAGLRWSF